jgi:hypothetical protein
LEQEKQVKLCFPVAILKNNLRIVTQTEEIGK